MRAKAGYGLPMTKDLSFYPRFVLAVFRRGKAETLPYSYLEDEARKVLKGDELEEFQAALQTMVNQGQIVQAGAHYRLEAAPRA